MDYILMTILLAIFTKFGNSFPFSENFTEIECGDAFPYKCPNSKYRSIDGSCNNRLKPQWGMPRTRFARLLPAHYADGYFQPAVSKNGNPLPLARDLSYVFSPDRRILSKKFTLAALEYTHIIVHDLVLTDVFTETPENQCCSADGKLARDPRKFPLCYPPFVSKDDPSFGKDGITCLNSFIRKRADIHQGCATVNDAATQLTVVTHYLDLSLLYGNHEKQTAGLRAWKNGRMLVEKRNNLEWPPSEKTCRKDSATCYKTGDKRANFSFQITLYHVILVRQHNRFADALAKLNPHWDDEKVFQEARRLFIAQHQYLSYYECLPQFFGLENTLKNGLFYNTTNYVDDYNPAVDPSAFNEVVAAVFRAFHSTLAENSTMVNEKRDPPYGSYNVDRYFNSPGIIEKDNNYDSLVRGLATQPQEALDQYYNNQITTRLDLGPGRVRTDVRALDVQRSRDHGLQPYNEYRQICGFPRAKKWDDFLDFISAENVKNLSKLYESPDDVDLSVGALLEIPAPNILFGPTYLCIIIRQFYKSRVGDRFFFENGKSGNPFTLDQLNQIRKASVARFLCDNTGIRSIQRNALEQITETNPLVPCETIPSIDLSFWKEN